MSVDLQAHWLYNDICSRERVSVLYGRELARDTCPLHREEGNEVSEIRVGENESLESALKRFKRKCARSGVLAEVRKREHYEKPSVKRKKKAEAARKRKY